MQTMKLIVGYDQLGRILMAAPGGPEAEDRPVGGHGMSIGEFDVPDEFTGRPLDEIVRLSRVDLGANRLVKGTGDAPPEVP
jgi:hypothetical protein